MRISSTIFQRGAARQRLFTVLLAMLSPFLLAEYATASDATARLTTVIEAASLELADSLRGRPDGPSFEATMAHAKYERRVVEAYAAAYKETKGSVARAVDKTLSVLPDRPFQHDLASSEVLDVLQRGVQDVARQSQEVSVALDTYLKVTREYSDSAARTTTVCLEAAAEFRKFAEAERYTAQQNDYRDMARTFELLAKRYGEVPASISASLRQAEQLRPYLQSTQVLMSRMHAAFDAIPRVNAMPPASPVDARFTRYVSDYNSLRDALRSFNGLLEDKSQKSPDRKSALLPIPSAALNQTSWSNKISRKVVEEPGLPAEGKLPVYQDGYDAYDFDHYVVGMVLGSKRIELRLQDPVLDIGEVHEVKSPDGSGMYVVRIRNYAPYLSSGRKVVWAVEDAKYANGYIFRRKQ